MTNKFLKIATGRTHHATFFLLVLMCVLPTAFFTDWKWLDHIAWLMLIILGVLIFITGLSTLSDGRQSKYWPTAWAYNIHCSLNYRTSNGTKRYTPNIKCAFKVDNTEYTGTLYDFSSEYVSKEVAQQKIDEIKAKSELYIYYKPTDPEINVINPGIRFVHFLRILCGLATVILASLFWLGIIEIR